jgi:transcriptional regulator with XRE-family HTH domain
MLVKRLVSLRRDSGVSQDSLAKALGLSQSDISKIERFDRRLDILETLEWLHCMRGNDAAEELVSIIKDTYEC